MVDLRFADLPDEIEVGGEWAAVRTGFREWMAFGWAAERGLADSGVFPGEPPDGDWLPAALEFYRSENPCPRGGRAGGARPYDYVADGDYIVAAFQQAYGIDLTDPGLEMHWHRFLALFRGLPEDTRMARIIGYRTWAKRGRGETAESEARALRDEWALPPVDAPGASYEEQDDPLEGLYEEPDLSDYIPRG